MKKLTLFFVMAMLLIAFNVSAANFTEASWVKTTVNEYGIKYNVWTHTVTLTTADTVAYTAVTPEGLDTKREWEVLANATGETMDATGVAVHIIGGWSEDSAFGFTNGSIAFTDMVDIKTIFADCKAAIGDVTVDPLLTTADVTDTIVNIVKLPFYGIYYVGTDALIAVDLVTIIVQVAPGQ